MLSKLDRRRLVLRAFAGSLQECFSGRDLLRGKAIHGELLKSGYGDNTFLGDYLIRLYSFCGRLDTAVLIFESLPCRNTITFNFMIGAYVQHGRCREALNVFLLMEAPDAHTYSRVLGACCKPQALPTGRAIHQKILEDPSRVNTIVWNVLIRMYTKCGSIEEARGVFASMPDRNEVSWNSIIAANAQHGYLREALESYEAMDLEPTGITFASVLGVCRDLNKGKQIHDRIVAAGKDSEVMVQNALVFMYSKCNRIDLAEDCFSRIQHRDVVCWNTMIGGYVQHGHTQKALTLFYTMELEGISPDSVTFTSVLGACTNDSICRLFRSRVLHSGFDSHINVRNGLIAVYAQLGHVHLAREVFDETRNRNMSTWTYMLVAYAQRGHSRRALEIYEEMKQERVNPDFLLFPTIVTSCSSLEEGMKVHEHIVSTGSESTNSSNALITMYANCGCITQAKQVFDSMAERTVVSWTALISAYLQLGYHSEAVETYDEMEKQGTSPVPVTLAVVLGAYSHLGSLASGRKFHQRIIEQNLPLATLVQNSLINMYGKCGSVESAKLVFEEIKARNVISWTAMLAAFARNARPYEALELQCEMLQHGTMPSLVTFTCVLASCSHAGLVDEGLSQLLSMTSDFGLRPTHEHYSCIVDLLGRVGRLSEAGEFISSHSSSASKQSLSSNPNLDDVVWKALLSACKVHCNDRMGEFAAEQVASIVPDDTTSFLLLSNIHSELGDSSGSTY